MDGRGQAPGPQAYPTMRNKFGPPITLANMRLNGVRAVIATCEACRHKADVNVDALPERVTVPKAAQRPRCSSCGGSGSRPALHGIQPNVPACRISRSRHLERCRANGSRSASLGCKSVLPPVPLPAGEQTGARNGRQGRSRALRRPARRSPYARIRAAHPRICC